MSSVRLMITTPEGSVQVEEACDDFESMSGDGRIIYHPEQTLEHLLVRALDKVKKAYDLTMP